MAKAKAIQMQQATTSEPRYEQKIKAVRGKVMEFSEKEKRVNVLLTCEFELMFKKSHDPAFVW